MNDREYRRYQMFGRVQTFISDRTADFAAGSKAKNCDINLGKIILGLDSAKALQTGGDRTAKDVLLDGLRLDVQNIVRTAAAIDQDEPGFAGQFRAPDSPSHAALLTCADSILARLRIQPTDDTATQAAKTALAAKFTACELPSTFVQDLIDDRAAIDDAQDAVESADNDGVKSTAAIGLLIRDGMKEVNYLDAIMHNKYARQPDVLRAWQSASHIERAPQREKKVTPTNDADKSKAA